MSIVENPDKSIEYVAPTDIDLDTIRLDSWRRKEERNSIDTERRSATRTNNAHRNAELRLNAKPLPEDAVSKDAARFLWECDNCGVRALEEIKTTVFSDLQCPEEWKVNTSQTRKLLLVRALDCRRVYKLHKCGPFTDGVMNLVGIE